MRPMPRPVGPPARMVAVTAGIVAISGGALVGVPDSRRADGLTPQTIPRFLAGVVPPDVHDVRVNGVYGSGHGGTWQVIASFTWRNADGSIHGGTTQLPQRGGQPPLDSEFPPERVQAEHTIGWSLQRLGRALRAVDVGNAGLAMVELAITAAEGATLIACSASGTDVQADCAEYGSDGGVERRFDDRLLDLPELAAVSVQRASAPVEIGS